MIIRNLTLTVATIFCLSHGAHAAEIYAGSQYSIAGKNTGGLCQLVNGSACKKEEEGFFRNLWCQFKADAADCSINNVALRKILAGEVDLANVAADHITPDMQLRVLMNLSSDKKEVLVSRENFPEKDGLRVVTAVNAFLTNNRDKRHNGIMRQLINLDAVYSGRDALYAYLVFDREYPLHASL